MTNARFKTNFPLRFPFRGKIATRKGLAVVLGSVGAAIIHP